MPVDDLMLSLSHFPHLKVIALPRMSYGQEIYNLGSKDVQQHEQLQRSFMKRIQCILVNTTTSAAHGIRPIQ